MLTWLVMFAPGVALHVGNFPDVPSCLAAVNQVRVGAPPGVTVPGGVGFACVPPSTGKPQDPSPPP